MDKDIFMSFLKEIKVLAHVGEHENVVKFYGAMVEKIAERKEFDLISVYTSRAETP